MLLLDTSAIIEVLNGTKIGLSIKKEMESDKVITTVLNKYEIMVGIKPHEKEKTESFFEQMDVVPLTIKEMSLCIAINKKLTTAGKMINETDIFIAGICQELDAAIITLDRDFLRVPQLKVRVF